jgi:hypothetical protein
VHPGRWQGWSSPKSMDFEDCFIAHSGAFAI